MGLQSKPTNLLPLTKCLFMTVVSITGLWESRGLTQYVRAGLVPAQCGATTRVARTPRNPEDPLFFHELIARICVTLRFSFQTQRHFPNCLKSRLIRQSMT